MFKARYYNADGEEGKAVDLPTGLFDGTVNEAVLHQVVKAYRANRRQGTGSAKNRSAVAGGSRKPWRQKGTGRARQGTIRAAQWAGGGRAFPPIPHSWRLDVNRKVRSLARRSALNLRAEADRIIAVEELAFEIPQTGDLRRYLESIGTGGSKVLVLTDGNKPNVYLSGRNLGNVQTRPFGEESAYDVLWADNVVVERGALDKVPAAPAGRRARRASASEASTSSSAAAAAPAAAAPATAEEEE